ncbi:PAS domain S-box protein [Pseudoduganella umbonata]|uniref:Diguanylate cyclase (GGDEF)-like protein/PAS domain S-box-containing protein n=1 Tax=Pseudoduganella umbonata TaxID=864828 RepID=A0A4P8HKP3_9BURK|nr:PAS domain S-box protein [Pseudoduganella umbonata]MBB3220191.1 diguanylate cyclase (GGDEF)-like protein/PAS domain S-box-containing protein [Pseudoduganella umbonata]QCP10177.1 PAS domain S-box protein [Pseudoduganella umbonata]
MSASIPSSTSPATAAVTDEAGRIALLYALQLLDTAPEPVFDRVTRLASRLLGVPVTLFSLVDRDRQWFKSRVGIDVPETPRAISFCSHAIEQREPLVVNDATRDSRFADNPLVRGDMQVRFYAGVPIRSLDGHAIGTLCALDTRPRELAADELAAFQDLAVIVADEVHRRELLARARDHLQVADAAIRSTEARLRSIFELASFGIALIDAGSGEWLTVNSAACAILGYTEEQFRRLTFRQITHPDDVADDVALVRDLLAGNITQFERQKRYLRHDGSAAWVHTNVSLKRDDAGKPEYFIVAVIDIGARKQAEHELAALHAQLEARVDDRTRALVDANRHLTEAIGRQQQAEAALRTREAELSSILEYANDAYIGLDEQGRVSAWNRQAEHTFGWTAAEADGKPLEELIIPADFRDRHAQGLARYLATGVARVLGKRLELPARRKDGSQLTVEIRIHANDIDGRRTFSAFLHDISARKAAEARREHDIRHDPLTGLLNRRALEELLPQAQSRSQRHGIGFALLFIDLDGFKAVNDRLGHDAGDALLCEVGRRLRASVRQNDSVVRLAGDEFIVVLEGQPYTMAQARTVAAKLIAALAQPVAVTGTVKETVQVGASIGIALHGAGTAQAPGELLREADRQMYLAKEAGRGSIRPDEV